MFQVGDCPFCLCRHTTCLMGLFFLFRKRIPSSCKAIAPGLALQLPRRFTKGSARSQFAQLRKQVTCPLLAYAHARLFPPSTAGFAGPPCCRQSQAGSDSVTLGSPAVLAVPESQLLWVFKLKISPVGWGHLFRSHHGSVWAHSPQGLTGLSE